MEGGPRGPRGPRDPGPWFRGSQPRAQGILTGRTVNLTPGLGPKATRKLPFLDTIINQNVSAQLGLDAVAIARMEQEQAVQQQDSWKNRAMMDVDLHRILVKSAQGPIILCRFERSLRSVRQNFKNEIASLGGSHPSAHGPKPKPLPWFCLLFSNWFFQPTAPRGIYF